MWCGFDLYSITVCNIIGDFIFVDSPSFVHIESSSTCGSRQRRRKDRRRNRHRKNNTNDADLDMQRNSQDQENTSDVTCSASEATSQQNDFQYEVSIAQIACSLLTIFALLCTCFYANLYRITHGDSLLIRGAMLIAGLKVFWLCVMETA